MTKAPSSSPPVRIWEEVGRGGPPPHPPTPPTSPFHVKDLFLFQARVASSYACCITSTFPASTEVQEWGSSRPRCTFCSFARDVIKARASCSDDLAMLVLVNGGDTTCRPAGPTGSCLRQDGRDSTIPLLQELNAKQQCKKIFTAKTQLQLLGTYLPVRSTPIEEKN